MHHLVCHSLLAASREWHTRWCIIQLRLLMMSAVVLETCWGDNVIYILQNKKLGTSSWSQKLIYLFAVSPILPKIKVLQNTWLAFARFIISYPWNWDGKKMVKKAVPSFVKKWKSHENFVWKKLLLMENFDSLPAYNNAWPIVNAELKIF
jgi:hypothetical protein